ncbi:MAG: methyltransferase domain-containing protein [Planctomycetia bacterium]|nr:methyltransferase domain-containing protein [Planctomycetia bacterium]
MISFPDVKKSEIRSHYDWATPFYRLLWGRHIHHGLWNGDEGPRVAQQRLVTTMIELAGIGEGMRVLDVGCGMGGSSMELARLAGCRVTGVTLSPVQRFGATLESRMRGLAGRTTFLCDDAERVEFEPSSFDVVWSVECTEHLFDKPAFFRRAAKWLRPGGTMIICAWLAGDDVLDVQLAEQTRRVCEGFLCPSLGSPNDYQGWMHEAGLDFVSYDDWTSRIVKTWEICQRRVERSRVRVVARAVPGMVKFLDSFETISSAYRSGAMKYGCFVFRAPVRVETNEPNDRSVHSSLARSLSGEPSV